MKSWKVLLGVGGACAICCALPIGATLVSLGAGVSGGVALYSGSLNATAGVAFGVLTLLGIWVWLRYRKNRKADACACSGATNIALERGGCNAKECS